MGDTHTYTQHVDITLHGLIHDRAPPGLYMIQLPRGLYMIQLPRGSPDVLVSAWEEPAEYVDCEHSEATLTLDLHDGEHSLIQDGMTNILIRVGIGSHLWGGGVNIGQLSHTQTAFINV